MELSKTIIIDPDSMPDFVKALASEVRGIILSENREYEQYLNTTQLSKLFPFSKLWFNQKINQGLFGKKARNGECMATYKEVEKYLFESKI